MPGYRGPYIYIYWPGLAQRGLGIKSMRLHGVHSTHTREV